MLLADAEVKADQVRGCRQRLERFLDRYVPLFYRKEQGHNARIVVEGLLGGLERKTAEPIAREHGVPRKPIQFFVGSGKWNDETVMAKYVVMWSRRWAIRKGFWYSIRVRFPRRDAFVRGRAGLVRSAGQGGELPDRAVHGLCDRPRAGSIGSSAASLSRVGGRSGASGRMPCAGRGEVSETLADGVGDAGPSWGLGSAWGGGGG